MFLIFVCCCKLLQPETCYLVSQELSNLAQLNWKILEKLPLLPFQIFISIPYRDFVGIGFWSSRLHHYVEIFSLIFLNKSSLFLPWCICHTGILLSEKVVEFHAVCLKYFVLFVLSCLISRQSLHLCWYFLFCLFSHLIHIFLLFCFTFLSSLFLFIVFVISSLFISAKVESSFLIPFIFSCCIHLTQEGGSWLHSFCNKHYCA